MHDVVVTWEYHLGARSRYNVRLNRQRWKLIGGSKSQQEADALHHLQEELTTELIDQRAAEVLNVKHGCCLTARSQLPRNTQLTVRAIERQTIHSSQIADG